MMRSMLVNQYSNREEARWGVFVRAFENKQTANPQMQLPCVHRYRENDTLLTAGFKRTENVLLWEKNGVRYGREAALQEALRELREEGDTSRFWGA